MPEAKKLDPKVYRENPPVIAAYLTEAFDKSAPIAVLQAIQAVMRTQNVRALSELTGMRRESLYRTFGGKADPRFSTVMKVLAAFDVRLVVVPLPTRQKPPRPKLGRPNRTKGPRT